MSGRTPLPPAKARVRESAAALAAALHPACLVLIPLIAFAASELAGAAGRVELIGAATSARAYRVLGFTVFQAALSASIASALGVPLGFIAARGPRSLARPLSALFSIPFAAPSLLVAIGLAGFWGVNGTVNGGLRAVGAEKPFVVYGLAGILLAHAFFNFPIAGRLVADSLAAADPAREEAAMLLGAGRARRFITIGLREASPGIAAAWLLSFIYCLQSFGIVLLLGGGPAASTVEVEIYEAMRTSFREGKALFLGLVSMAVSGAAAVLHLRASSSISRPSGRETPVPRAGKARGRISSIAIAAPYLALLLILAGGPAFSVIAEAFSPTRGTGAFPSIEQFAFIARGGIGSPLAVSAFNTVTTGAAAALLSTALALVCAGLRGGRRPGRSAAIGRILPLAVSPLILSAGLSPFASALGERIALPVFHALLAFPLASSAIESGLEKLPPSLIDAARLLGSSRLKAFADVALPAVRPSILSGLAFSFAVSAADVAGVLTLSRSDFPTLSLLVFRLAGAYRLGAACAAGLALLALTGTAFAFAGRKR